MNHAPAYRDVRPVRELVTDDEAWEAKVFLDETTHDIAEAQTDAEYAEYMIGVAEATGATLSDETSVDKKKWDARTSSTYAKQVKLWREARFAFLKLKARRDAAQLKVELWRTIRADKRAREVQEFDANRSAPRREERRGDDSRGGYDRGEPAFR